MQNINRVFEIFQVDSFTEKPFSGNPAGVCIVDKNIDDITLKNIAMEMAVSETAFVYLKTMRLRWFSPEVEVDLCGHGTLATAAVLYYKNIIAENQTINFETLSGILSVTVRDKFIEMDFPKIEVQPTAKNINKLSYLGIDEKEVLFYGKAGEKDFVHVKDEEILKGVSPKFSKLRELPGRAIIVTSKSDSRDLDFISRNFAPWVGVDEDPVTGSSHCALADYWGNLLGKSTMSAYQASQRGGMVHVEIQNNNRIKLSGKAVITIEGLLKI